MHARMLRDVGLTKDSLLELADALEHATGLLGELEYGHQGETTLPLAVLRLRSEMNENLVLLVRQAAVTVNDALRLYSGRSIDKGNVIQLQRFRTATEQAQDIATFVAQCFVLVKSIETYVASQRALGPC